MTSEIVKVSVVGVSGFTGVELIKILINHPFVDIVYLTSRQYAGKKLAEVFPRLETIEKVSDIVIDDIDYGEVAEESDVVFLCLPHMASQEIVKDIIGKCCIIDLSADFRLDDAKIFKQYYHEDHKCPDLLNGQFVYGLPELNRELISQSDYVANPGCFALLIQNMLLPFIEEINHVDVMAVSGTTGGGRKARDPMEHPYCSHNMKSYLINSHRHIPEIIKTAGISADQLNFTPTVGPFLKGIFATAFVQLKTGVEIKPDYFKESFFVREKDEVNLNHVLGTNFCDVSYEHGSDECIIIQGAIDNLIAGASGTAVQNMNLMFGLEEKTGLEFSSPVY